MVVGSAATDVLAETAQRLGIWLSVGVDERDELPGRAGLYGGPDDWLSRGNTAIIGPGGEVLAGPLVGEEGVLYAEIDAERARAGRQQFDPVGHYSRSDVLRLVVDTTPRAAASFGGRDDTAGPTPRSAVIETNTAARTHESTEA